MIKPQESILATSPAKATRKITLADLRLVLFSDTSALALCIKETLLEKDSITFISQPCHVDRLYFTSMRLTNGFSELTMPTDSMTEITYGDQVTMKLSEEEFRQLKWPA